jgi:large subunit ribosomal protein L25
MEQIALVGTSRSETGKGPARRLRAEGAVPGVVYGMHREPIPLSVNARELDTVLGRQAGTNVLLTLEIAGAEISGDRSALLKAVQRHPVTQDLESVDFQWVDVTEAISVSVPIAVEGTPDGADLGGVLEYGLTELEISCLPTEIPESIVVDVSHLGLQESAHVSDLQVPEGIEVLSSAEDVVATCAIVRIAVEEEEEEEAELEEGEEPAEGEEAAEEEAAEEQASEE